MTRPARIRLSRAKGWRKPENAIVVARPTRWGNPFSVQRLGRPTAIRLFELTARELWDAELLADLGEDERRQIEDDRDRWLARLGGRPTVLAPEQLMGHDLACWCRLDQQCHADVLLALANP